MKQNPRVERLVNAIAGYLAAHSSAADTLDGVSKWWIHGCGLEGVSRAEVERALDHLSVKGQVSRIIMPDGNVLYSRMKDG